MSDPKNPTSFNLPDRETLANCDVGSLGLAILTLTKELWVLTDRVHVLEAVLTNNNLDVAAEVQKFEPDSQMTDMLHKESTGLVERVLATLSKD